MKNLLIKSLFTVTFLLILAASQTMARDQDALKSRLAYLKDIPEIAWVEFDGNNVYIGFKERPSDLRTIVNGAALWGNKAYGFGVHVWAVEARYRGWRPGEGPYYCEATARYGKVQDSSCRYRFEF